MWFWTLRLNLNYTVIITVFISGYIECIICIYLNQKVAQVFILCKQCSVSYSIWGLKIADLGWLIDFEVISWDYFDTCPQCTPIISFFSELNNPLFVLEVDQVGLFCQKILYHLHSVCSVGASLSLLFSQVLFIFHK